MKLYPLSDTFMAVALLGFVLSMFMMYTGGLNDTWGITFSVIFAVGVISALRTTKAVVSRHF